MLILHKRRDNPNHELLLVHVVIDEMKMKEGEARLLLILLKWVIDCYGDRWFEVIFLHNTNTIVD